MRLGLVLSGGAAKASFEAGVVTAIEAAGLRPSILSGTSAGALNAAGLAAGLGGDGLADLWTSLTDDDVFRLRRDVWRLPRPRGLLEGGNLAGRLLAAIGWTWFLHTAPLRRTLLQVFGGARVPVQAGVTLAVSAVEMATGGLVRFTNVAPPPHRTGPRYQVVKLSVEHLLASAALPLVFRPASVEGTAFWDGGLVANTPLAPALAYEPDAVIVVTTATLARPAPRPSHLGDALSLLVDNVLAHSLHSDLARARELNEIARIAPQATHARPVELLVVEPAGLDLGAGLRFDPGQAERNIALGRRVGEQALEQWRVQGRLPA